MKLHYSLGSFLMILGTFLITSCGTAPPAEPTMTPGAKPNESDDAPSLKPAATAPALPTAEPLPEDYPPPAPTLQPTNPADYPGPATVMPTVDPYPGGMVWIIRPVGIQCEDGTTLGYGDLSEAVATLTAAGLRVTDSEMIEMMVTTSCGSPTSAHYRVQISSDDLDTALSMGWDREGI
jgi:hypothetical protein